MTFIPKTNPHLMDTGTIILILVALFVVFMIAKGVRIVQQSEAMVIERFGKYLSLIHI